MTTEKGNGNRKGQWKRAMEKDNGGKKALNLLFFLAKGIWLEQSRTQQHHRTDARWPSDQHAGGRVLRGSVGARLDGGRGAGFLGRRAGVGGHDTIVGGCLDHLRAVVRHFFWNVEPQRVCSGGDESHLEREARIGGRYRQRWFHLWSIHSDSFVCLCSQLARGVFSVVFVTDFFRAEHSRICC